MAGGKIQLEFSLGSLTNLIQKTTVRDKAQMP